MLVCHLFVLQLKSEDNIPMLRQKLIRTVGQKKFQVRPLGGGKYVAYFTDIVVKYSVRIAAVSSNTIYCSRFATVARV